MTDGTTLLTENEALFSPISHIYYEYYDDASQIINKISKASIVILILYHAVVIQMRCLSQLYSALIF